MQQVTLGIQDESTGQVSRVSGVLEAHEVELLDEFVRLSERASSSTWVLEGCPAQLNVNWREGQQLEVKAELPDWEKVQSFLLRFRPFILERERTYFPKVANLIARRLQSPAVDRVLAPMRDYFMGKSLQSRIIVRSNAVVLNSPDTLDKWLNAYEFHQDQGKRAWLETLHKIMPLESTRVFFLVLLTDRLKAVLQLAGVIRVLLGQVNEVKIRVKRHGA